MAAKKKTAVEIHIPKQRIERFDIWVGVIGTTGEDTGSLLVVHQFSEKARSEIRDRQGQKAKGPRGVRLPHSEFVCSKYVDAKTLMEGLPCAAFRRAIIDAASFVSGVTKVELRGSVFVQADGRTLDGLNIVKVYTTTGTAKFREDVVRLPTGSADLRYRSSYENWGAKLTLTIDPDIISAEQVHHLVERAGFSVGLCESRPQKSGEWGQFKLISEAQFKKLKPVTLTPKDFKILQTQMSMRNFGDDEDATAAPITKKTRKAS